jgi:hypothetical protein
MMHQSSFKLCWIIFLVSNGNNANGRYFGPLRRHEEAAQSLQLINFFEEDEAFWSRSMRDMSLSTGQPTPTPLPPTPTPHPTDIISPTSKPATSQPTVERILLYSNDFETPKQTVDRIDSFCNIDQRGINTFYGTEENMFKQRNTVEVFLVSNSMWNSSVPYSDQQEVAGSYAISMLSTNEDDLLGLGFETSGKAFVNIAMDISSIDITCAGGPFGIDNPIFRVSLLDDPSGTVPLTGIVLDSANMTGTVGPNQWTFLWTRNSISLKATGSTTGRVSVVFDLLQSGYGALDNLLIQASDEPGSAQ